MKGQSGYDGLVLALERASIEVMDEGELDICIPNEIPSLLLTSEIIQGLVQFNPGIAIQILARTDIEACV
jgi:hypothetical protein